MVKKEKIQTFSKKEIELIVENERCKDIIIMLHRRLYYKDLDKKLGVRNPTKKFKKFLLKRKQK